MSTGFSYHELTANAPRNSPAQRKQFLLICVGGFSVLLHAIISAGIMEPVSIYDDGIYPGGEFVHKLLVRDYSASMGATRLVGEDLDTIQRRKEAEEDGMNENDERNLDTNLVKPAPKGSFANLTYTVFMDNTDVPVGNGMGRFCSGVLLDPTTLFLKDRLLEANTFERRNENEGDFWSHDYTVTTLPSVKAVIATFPFTNGFISALIHQFKVFPAMVKFAQEHNVERPVVISSRCDVDKSMCTHYIPLEQGATFLMGQTDSATYAKTIPPINYLDIKSGIEKIKSAFGFGSSSDVVSSDDISSSGVSSGDGEL